MTKHKVGYDEMGLRGIALKPMMVHGEHYTFVRKHGSPYTGGQFAGQDYVQVYDSKDRPFAAGKTRKDAEASLRHNFRLMNWRER